MIHLCIADKGRDHRSYGHEDDLPETDQEVFDGRFFFIHPDNVNEAAAKYEKLFK